MQSLLFVHQQTDLQSIRDCLGAVFGKIRNELRWDPTNQFVRSFISGRTYDEISELAFERLIERYRSCDGIADAPIRDIEAMLTSVRFPEKTAHRDRPKLSAAAMTASKTAISVRLLSYVNMCMKRVEKDAIAVTRLRRAETMASV
jgi:hypothetical protein